MSLLATTASTVTLADHHDGPGWWPLIPLFWFGAFILFFFLVTRLGWWVGAATASTTGGTTPLARARADWPNASRLARSTSRSTAAGLPSSRRRHGPSTEAVADDDQPRRSNRPG